MNILVLGAGTFGTAIANEISRKHTYDTVPLLPIFININLSIDKNLFGAYYKSNSLILESLNVL